MHRSKTPLTDKLHVQVDSEVAGQGKVRRAGARVTAHIQNTLDPIHVVVRGNGNEFLFRKGGHPQTVHMRLAHDRVERDQVVDSLLFSI